MNNGKFDLGSITPEALSGAIAKLSEHPELISMVAGALGKSGDPSEVSSPTSAPSQSIESRQSPGDISSLISSLAPVMSTIGKSHKRDPRFEHRDALLCALKPYLNEDRRRMVDQIMKLGQIGDILKIIK